MRAGFAAAFAPLLLIAQTGGTAPAPDTGGPVAADSDMAQLDFRLEGVMMQGGVMLGHAPDGAAEVRFNDTAIPVAPDGSFIIAFNRDEPGIATLAALYPDGQSYAETLNVAPRDWDIQYIDAPLRGGVSSEAFLQRRAPELERIEAARAVRSDSQGWRQKFIWPVRGRISGKFGSQRVFRGEPAAFHGGVDVTTGVSGTPIVAPADGVVTLAAATPFTLEGNLLVIDHGMGLNSAFLHLSRIAVREGDVVRQGDVIGNIGATGRATGPHLHWAMKWQDARIDPLLLAGPME